MGRLSLKSTVLLAMTVLVVGSCLLTSFVATQLYSQNLKETLEQEARQVAGGIAGQLAELVLVNDLVSVQRLLDSQFARNADRGYALITLQGRVLAHTFDQTVPRELQPLPTQTEAAHLPDPPLEPPRPSHLTLSDGRAYLDMSWPLLQGHAGMLRMGFSMRGIHDRIARLWWETAALTLLILTLALVTGLLWLRRVGKPLAALVEGIESVGSGNLTTRVPVSGQNEVATLARAFNRMGEYIEGSMLRLEVQADALERGQRQLHMFNRLVTTFAALDSPEDMGRQTLQHAGDIADMPRCLLLLDHNGRRLLRADERGFHHVPQDQSLWNAALALLEGRESVFATRDLRAPLAGPTVTACPAQTVLCIVHEHQLCGALLLGHGRTPPGQDELAALKLLLHQVSGSLHRALRHEGGKREGAEAGGNLEYLCGMLGRSRHMRRIFQRIEDVAPSEATVLITGESGTGKELAAHALHQLSPRHDKPFVVINCAAYPESLLESELFGYEKGAFTGASRQKPGRFEQADGGTVFLDEIGEISPLAQVRLLRVLQSRQFERVGGETTLSVDVRVVAATNRDLAAEVRAGRFREDLYYRLDVISLFMPPLRERPEDIPLLARRYLASLSRRQGQEPPVISPDALRLLMAWDWPGNVRELENTLEYSATLCRDNAVTAADLPEKMRAGKGPAPARTLEEQEAEMVRAALESCRWNRKAAAARLGIGRTTLYAKMKRHDIRCPGNAQEA